MFNPASVRFKGPLKPHVNGFWSELISQGYSPLSAGNLLRVAAHLSRWLDRRRLGSRDLTIECLEQFAAHRRRQGYTQFLTPRAAEPLLAYLRKVGAGPARRQAALTPVDRFVADYATHLAERGLAASTISGYTYFARRFVTERSIDTRRKWSELKPDDITEFVLEQARRWSVKHVQHHVTSLRSLLRYVHVRGWTRCDLASCVPAVAGWRLSGLPRALEPHEVKRVLGSCDRRSVVGRRDTAIVQLLLRLGLRAGDATALTLDDLDWRAGEIVVRGKERCEARLPLPRDVGQALASYLSSSRPRTDERRVFLRSRAPYAPLSTGGLISVVRHALSRAGVSGGAHVLRHTAATQMLRRGASLAEIGHVLRHQSVETTAIYAKVDFAALRTLVQPWPGGAA